jgi:hypothetical protein
MAREAARQQESAIRAAFARPRVPAGHALVEDFLSREPIGQRSTRRRELLYVVLDRAPRLIDAATLPALSLLTRGRWLRPPGDWVPQGRSTQTLFRSLAEHLLARFRVPAVLWTAFFDEEAAPLLARVAIHVVSGGSLYDTVRSGLMPVPLTRKMCHELLSHPDEPTFLAAVRRAQVKAAGGDGRVLRAWMASRAGRSLHNRPDEEFWATVLVWFSRNPALCRREAAPLVDYIAERRRWDPSFSMNGRTPRAMLHGMWEWHGDLGRCGALDDRIFPSSGLLPLDIDRSRRDSLDREIREVWHVREILTGKALAEEGRVMAHCVYSYGTAVERGESSIWTLTLEDNAGHGRRLTIEVRLALRRIVQVRGRWNRSPEAREMIPLRAWAGRNSLEIAAGSL